MTGARPFATTPDALLPRTLRRAGCDLHYWTGGPADRPLVVFMHGATMDHRMFNSQLAAILPDHRVLVWDARGHGRSQPTGEAITVETCVADMLAILDRESVDAAVFCRQSFGGYIAQSLYLAAPTRGPYALHASRQIGRQEFLNIWRAVTEAIDTVGIPAVRFALPMLLMHGDMDRTGTIRRDMPRWAASLPTARYCIVPHAGHNANQDNPAFFNRELVRFLKALPG